MIALPDYEKAVMEDYKIKKENGELSLILSNPTPSTLRDECLAVCRRKYDKTDARTLWAFFGQGSDLATFLHAIGRYETEKFRPLVNYLKGRTRSPGPRIVELLAWLIDFQPRPFDRFKKEGEIPVFPKKGPDVVTPGTVDEGEEIVVMPDPELVTPVKRAFNLSLLRAFVVIILLAGGVVGIRHYTYTGKVSEPQGSIFPPVPASGACMFWNGDHYEPVACGKNPGDILAVPFDSEKLNHFRKINRPDTITDESIGKLWYVKYHRTVEFYTAPGFHPIDSALRLHPVTKYMIGKYCHPGQQSGLGSALFYQVICFLNLLGYFLKYGKP